VAISRPESLLVAPIPIPTCRDYRPRGNKARELERLSARSLTLRSPLRDDRRGVTPMRCVGVYGMRSITRTDVVACYGP